MGIIIKKRFGPRNFLQYLHLKDVYSVGPKPRKKQQMYIKNPQEYTIPQSTVNSVLRDMQQGETVENKGASKHFAKYYGGMGDKKQLKQIYKHFGNTVEKDEFVDMYKCATPKPYRFLYRHGS